MKTKKAQAAETGKTPHSILPKLHSHAQNSQAEGAQPGVDQAKSNCRTSRYASMRGAVAKVPHLLELLIKSFELGALNFA